MWGWTSADIPEQRGRVVVVTGANSGLGFESALALARAGAHVVMAARDPARGEAAVARVRTAVPGASLELSRLDLASLASIRDFAARTRESHPRIDVLLNNAGVMAVPRALTADGFELQFGTDHLGPFALTALLLPALRDVAGSRIVTVTSLARWMGRLRFDDLHGERRYSRWGAYGQAKLANLVFAVELQRRLSAAGASTISVAAHPGYANTNLQTTSATTSAARLELAAYPVLNRVIGQSAAAGAWPQLHAATAPDVRGGQLFAPMLGWRGRPRREPIEPRARNRENGRRLFEVSEAATGVRFDLPN